MVVTKIPSNISSNQKISKPKKHTFRKKETLLLYRKYVYRFILLKWFISQLLKNIKNTKKEEEKKRNSRVDLFILSLFLNSVFSECIFRYGLFNIFH